MSGTWWRCKFLKWSLQLHFVIFVVTSQHWNQITDRPRILNNFQTRPTFRLIPNIFESHAGGVMWYGSSANLDSVFFNFQHPWYGFGGFSYYVLVPYIIMGGICHLWQWKKILNAFIFWWLVNASGVGLYNKVFVASHWKWCGCFLLIHIYLVFIIAMIMITQNNRSKHNN